MIITNSILYKSGQGWKYWLMFIGIIISGFFLFIPLTLIDSLSSKQFAIYEIFWPKPTHKQQL